MNYTGVFNVYFSCLLSFSYDIGFKAESYKAQNKQPLQADIFADKILKTPSCDINLILSSLMTVFEYDMSYDYVDMH